ncbi:hypothetical protein QFE97_15085 [Bacillus subtilis]|nr:hypothetical protein QFE97_15085 [Bacillus subtilis]
MRDHILLTVGQRDPATASASGLLHVLTINDKQMPAIMVSVSLEQSSFGIFPQFSPFLTGPVQDIISR